METKIRSLIKYVWAIAMIISGLLMNRHNAGSGEFMGYGSVGNYLIFIGFLSVIIVMSTALWKKKKIVDERMEFIAAKAHRMTFMVLVITAFAIIIIDGIEPITIPYHLFMSYLICGLLMVLYGSYRILLRYY